MKRKPNSTYPVNRRQPYRRQVMLPEPIEKCAYCRIRKGNRFGVDVREYDYEDGTWQLICDRCITEAARGAKMDPDKDEWLVGRPRVQLIGKGRHEYGSQLREPDGKFTVRR